MTNTAFKSINNVYDLLQKGIVWAQENCFLFTVDMTRPIYKSSNVNDRFH